MEKLILLFAFACWTGISAQPPVNNKDSLTAKKITVTTSLTDYIPRMTLETKRYNIGVEFYVKNGKSIYTNLGYIHSNGSAGGFFKVSSLGTQGMSMEVEGRHYFKKHRILPAAAIIVMPHLLQYYSKERLNTGYYTGINTSYQYSLTQRETSNKDPYYVTQNNVGLLAMIGYQCQKKYKLIIDQSIGLGVVFVHSTSSNSFGLITGNSYGNFNDFKGILPNIAYEFRIGF